MLNYKKPRFWIAVIIIIIVTAVGMGLIMNLQFISPSKEESIQIGKYVTEDDLAWLEIKEGNQFLFNRHIAINYDPTGSYIIIDDKLVLQVNGDEKETIVFKIDEEKLVFESEGLVGNLIKKDSYFIYEKVSSN